MSHVQWFLLFCGALATGRSLASEPISRLVPQHEAILPPGVVTISAVFAQETVKKAKVELWRYSGDDKKKEDKQKLDMDLEDEDLNLFAVDSKSALEEEGAYCYTIQVEFKSGKDKKVKTGANCFLILAQLEAATPKPLFSPTLAPSPAPLVAVAAVPSKRPESAEPTHSPTSSFPSPSPMRLPTMSPTEVPTNEPSLTPTNKPTERPNTEAPSEETRVKFKVEVKWKADKYAGEFTYQLTDSSGNVVLEKERSNDKKGSTKGEIESGRTYCFRGTDDWGDGICCAEGSGGYELKVDGQKLLKGGAFRFSTGFLCFSVNEEGDATLVPPPATQFCEANDPDNFNICMEIVDVSDGKLEEEGLADDFSSAFLSAKDKWASVLKDDDGTSHALRGLFVDDVYIEAAAASIDGEGTSNGNILGFAGPGLTWKSNDGFTKAVSGYMAFDIADLSDMIDDDTFKSVVNHEILHVLGLGTLWSENGLYEEGGQYKGEHGNAAYQRILLESGATFDVNESTLPIEQDGGSGTAHSHLDEDCLDREISTGWIDDDNVLSNITIACLHDLGFSVDYSTAEPYTIADLSQCPSSRRLRNRKGSAHHRQWRQLTGKSTVANLDPRVVDYATWVGQEFLKANKPKGREFPKGVVDYGSRLVDVLFQDGSSRNIFSVIVQEGGEGSS